MTATAETVDPTARPSVDGLDGAGLTVLAEARWPESDDDAAPPQLPGFIVSTFSPLVAETAARCLRRRLATSAGPAAATAEAAAAGPAAVRERRATTTDPVTAVLISSTLGDLQSATHVARAVDAADRLSPLLFFQSVPNAVAGHIAARWNLTGPVVCLGDRATALAVAATLIEDGDADEALLIHVEQAVSADARDHAHAVLLGPAAEPQHPEPHHTEPHHPGHAEGGQP